MTDPIVEEVRNHRKAHTEKCKGDLEAICKDLRAVQSGSGHKVVRLPARSVPSSSRHSGSTS